MHTFNLSIGDMRHDTAQHAVDDTILQLEGIIDRTIETVAPDVPIGGDIDQPNNHTHALATLRQPAQQAVSRAARFAAAVHSSKGRATDGPAPPRRRACATALRQAVQ